MKKRFLSAGLAVVMAASLTACGGSGSASTTTAAAGEAKAEGESKAAESSAAADGASFKIGGIGPVTGGAAVTVWLYSMVQRSLLKRSMKLVVSTAILLSSSSRMMSMMQKNL